MNPTLVVVSEAPLSLNSSQPPIIDYEGSRYRTDFWEGQGREYEDLTERAALRRLLPPTGDTLLEVGAAFGRLAPLYAGYRRVVLMDYSLSLLQEARERLGHDPRFLFVAASAYEIPFAAHTFDTVVMVRVMHHLQNPALALTEIARILRGGGTFVLEYANKRNLKAILRYLLRRQSWSPFAQPPYEFVPLNYDFHPTWMAARLQQTGLQRTRDLAVSHFRLAALKRRVSASWLVRLDAALAGPGALLKLSPSVMTACTNAKPSAPAQGWFGCPVCGGTTWQEEPTAVHCAACQHSWPVTGGVYDFRQSVSRETGPAQ